MFTLNRDSAARLANLQSYSWMTCLQSLRGQIKLIERVDPGCNCRRRVPTVVSDDAFVAVANHPALEAEVLRLKSVLGEDIVVVSIAGAQRVL